MVELRDPERYALLVARRARRRARRHALYEQLAEVHLPTPGAHRTRADDG